MIRCLGQRPRNMAVQNINYIIHIININMYINRRTPTLLNLKNNNVNLHAET